MPITVRYGPAGQLMQAAADVGAGQARQRQKQIDLQRVGQVREQYAQRDQARQAAYEAALEQDRARMQAQLEQAKLAQRARAARQQPTARPNQQRDTPLNREVREARAAFQQQSATPEGATEDQGYGAIRGPGGEVVATAGGETVTAQGREAAQRMAQDAENAPMQQAVQGLSPQGGGFVQSEPRQAADPATDAKQAIAEAINAQRLPEAQRQAISRMIQNPEISPQDFRITVSDVSKQVQQARGAEDASGMTPAQRAQYQYNYVQDQASESQEQVKQLRQSLPIDPGTQTPSEAMKNIDKQPEDVSWWPGYAGGGAVSKEQKQAMKQQLRRYYQTYTRAQLQEEQQATMAGMRPTPAFQSEDGTGVTASEVQQTAQNRDMSVSEVIEKLNLRPVK